MEIHEIIATRKADPAWDWDDDISAEIKQHIKRRPMGDPAVEQLCDMFPCEASEAYEEMDWDG